MTSRKEAKAIIRKLKESNLFAECPECGQQFKLRHAGLFYLDDFSPQAEQLYQERLEELREYEMGIRELRKSIKKRSKVVAEAVNIGLLLERLAPCMKAFPFERNDCRSLFDPIDYIIFDGLSRRDSVSKIVFMDIKTGRGRLKDTQKEIRKLVERKRVSWDTYRMEDKK